MNKQLLIIMVSSFLISCAEKPSGIATNKPALNNHNTKNIEYTCNRGVRLSVNFTATKKNDNDNDINNAIINGFTKQAIILPSKAVTSGFLYTNGKYSLRNKEKQITWTVGRMAPFKCSVGNKSTHQETVK